MVELINELPQHVAAYKAGGAISKEEYEEVVMARVNQVAEQFGKINFLVMLETSMGNYSIGAFIDYIAISFRHFSRWERMAIVTDEKWLRTTYSVLSHLVHGTIRTYELKDIKQAKAWVSGPLSS
jgi:hypothetical protein